ncbi:MAG TPA: PASTA domain-containing protein [Symbiobacteriaceae bacterium]|nr:PASTA domain-containing protein [Symbiobacteriaceae bacterium]
MHTAPSWRWNLVGLPWAEAEQILRVRGLTYETVITSPPGRTLGTGELRVVAERPRPEGTLFVLAHREYQRPPAGNGQGT